MSELSDFTLSVTEPSVYLALLTFERPPHNYFTTELVEALADTMDQLECDGRTRVVVLNSGGRHFCAGAEFAPSSALQQGNASLDVERLYAAAGRLFGSSLPVVACLQGAVIGGGLGLALSADFRVCDAATRLSANFARIGLHHGFGLTVSLPRVVGRQEAHRLLLTGRDVSGEEAVRIGLCDVLAERGDQLVAATKFAAELASNAPLAVRAIRATMRDGLAELVAQVTARERAEQESLFRTSDFQEGLAAARGKRSPRFEGV
jgi:2-(1,2-epoxy-1,2-dihydrophenyl)acetyl-CoA isomerase